MGVKGGKQGGREIEITFSLSDQPLPFAGMPTSSGVLVAVLAIADTFSM